MSNSCTNSTRELIMIACQDGTGQKTQCPKQISTEMQIFDNLITRTELSQCLNLSPSYISKLMVEEGLPTFKIGKSVRFRLSEVESWLNRKRKS